MVTNMILLTKFGEAWNPRYREIVNRLENEEEENEDNPGM